MQQTIVVGDSVFVIETIRQSLRNAAGVHVTGVADGRKCVTEAVRGSGADIILVDEMQNAEQALQRIRECRSALPSATLILLTMRMDHTWLAQALNAGAEVCLSKSINPAALGTIIRETVNRNVLCHFALDPGRDTAEGSQLTVREREILSLVSEGMTNSRIGRELWVTEQTVKFHLSNLYRKLGVANRTEASRYAQLHGLLAPSRPRVAEVPANHPAPVRELRPASLQAA
jgi:DNA-binding NarL/FixJ family response regulator